MYSIKGSTQSFETIWAPVGNRAFSPPTFPPSFKKKYPFNYLNSNDNTCYGNNHVKQIVKLYYTMLAIEYLTLGYVIVYIAKTPTKSTKSMTEFLGIWILLSAQKTKSHLIRDAMPFLINVPEITSRSGIFVKLSQGTNKISDTSLYQGTSRAGRCPFSIKILVCQRIKTGTPLWMFIMKNFMP